MGKPTVGSTGRNVTWRCTVILFTLKQTCIRHHCATRLLTISCCGLWRMCNYNFVLFCVLSLLRSADSVHLAAECGPGGGSRSKFLPDVFLRYPAAHFLCGHWHIAHCWWAHTQLMPFSCLNLQSSKWYLYFQKLLASAVQVRWTCLC